MSDVTQEEGAGVSRQDFEREIILRAREDPDFKQALLADARSAILNAYGVEIPPDVNLQVVQESLSTLYLVLPLQTDELTDEELAAVAGGTGAALDPGARLASSLASAGYLVRR